MATKRNGAAGNDEEDNYSQLHPSAQQLISEASANGTKLIFHCMYSKERGPRAARAAVKACPKLQVAVLRGGFRQCMSQLWSDDDDDGDHDDPSATGAAAVAAAAAAAAAASGRATGGPVRLFESVKREQWVCNGPQGLVWKPDLDPFG